MNRTDRRPTPTEAPHGRVDDVTAGAAVTVLMPVHNGERFLAEQVESILAQGHATLRVTVLDDASTDRSHQIAIEFADRDHRIEVLRNSENLGLIGSIRRLLGTVRTPYFALADQDDVWDERKVARSLEVLHESRADLVYSDVRLIDETGQVLVDQYLSSRRLRPLAGRDPIPFVFRNPAIGHTIVATRAVADVARDMPTHLVYHEAWIIASACTIGKVAYVDDQLGSYRLHATNVVGPKARSVLGRGVSIARERQRLRRRQDARTLSIVALAQLQPDLQWAADLLESTGGKRLLGLGRYGALLIRHARQIGMGPILVEMVLYAIDAATQIGSRDRSEVVATRPYRPPESS